MKKIVSICVGFIVFLWVVMFFASCETPYKITETITKDSLGKEIHVITKTYSNNNVEVVPQASLNVVTTPFIGYPFYSTYYTPFYTPRVIVPVRIGGGFRGGRGRH
jgi:hypothetical protein